MKITAPAKANITRTINSGDLNSASVKTAAIVDLIEADLELQAGYEPEVVVDLMNALLDVIADRRRAIDFAGHSIPEKILERIQSMVRDGKLLEVRY